MARRRDYFEVAGIDLRVESERLRLLGVFASGELPRRRPGLKVRRAASRPNRLGFAVPDQWRVSVTAYPGIGAGDVLETLLHELAHLHVGAQPGAHRWHGRHFKRTLARAMLEAYGVRCPVPPHSRHGVYADEIGRGLLEAGA